MDIISNEIKSYTNERVRAVAYELQLPFRLKELREYGWGGVEKARETYDGKSGGEKWLLHVKRCVFRAVALGGPEEKAKTGRRPAPKDERIREALEAFPKADDWKHLLEGCGYDEAKALGLYLTTNRDEFERSLDKKDFRSIEVHARERRIVLKLSPTQAKLIGITDPLWDEHWQEVSWAKKMEGAPRPSKRRSWPEMASPRAIAEALSKPGYVTAYQVTKWRERREQVPFEEFDSSWDDYLMYIRDPDAYERLRRRRGQAEE